MKKHKELIITTIICLLPMAIGAYFYQELPQKMAIHWGSEGANGWAPKAFACFGIPAIMAALNVLVHVLLENDPKKKNYGSAIKRFSKWLIPVVGLVCMVMMISAGLGHQVAIDTAVPALVGLSFVVLGNYLPKCKQNYTVGIKCPWTLHSEENWNKTHHLAGYLFILAGLVMIVTAFFAIPSGITLAIILATAFIPLIYSFALYKKGI